jgi:hypoxanthine phosphoribosyltransferase
MYKHKLLITKEKILQRINEIAVTINNDYDGYTLDIICILKGGFIFVSDLIRGLTIPLRVHFVQVSSYGAETDSSGTVDLHFSSVSDDLHGKHILLVEDILDTGITLDYLIKQLREEHPESLKTCVLLDKPSRRKLNIKADYIGFEIEDRFVIGYGLDYREIGRNLPYIAELDPSECR